MRACGHADAVIGTSIFFETFARVLPLSAGPESRGRVSYLMRWLYLLLKVAGGLAFLMTLPGVVLCAFSDASTSDALAARLAANAVNLLVVAVFLASVAFSGPRLLAVLKSSVPAANDAAREQHDRNVLNLARMVRFTLMQLANATAANLLFLVVPWLHNKARARLRSTWLIRDIPVCCVFQYAYMIVALMAMGPTGIFTTLPLLRYSACVCRANRSCSSSAGRGEWVQLPTRPRRQCQRLRSRESVRERSEAEWNKF